ncbi:hypothetical protein Aperf_G00000017569 [Anoplocephala perfoliata]
MPESQKVASPEKTQMHLEKREIRDVSCAHDANACIVASSPFVTKTPLIEHENPSSYNFSSTLLELKKANEVVIKETFSPRNIFKLTQDNGSLLSPSAAKAMKKEEISLIPQTERLKFTSEDTIRQPQSRAAAAGISANSDSERTLFRGTVCPGSSFNLPKNNESAPSKPQLMRENLTIRLMQDSDNLLQQFQKRSSSQMKKQAEPDLQIHYRPVRKFPPKYEKNQIWTMDNMTISSSSTDSAQLSTLRTSLPFGSSIPYECTNKKLKKQPLPSPLMTPISPITAVKEEVDQTRSMILLVLEELVNTEGSYLHVLSQFLLLREGIFAPNWRIDRQKFIRLFPAAVDDLCNLHRESFESMKQAFDRITKESCQPDEVDSKEESAHKLPQSPSSLYAHQPHPNHRFHRRHINKESTRDNEADNAESPEDSRKSTPFTVLLELIEGRRPLGGCANFRSNSTSRPNPSSRNASAWSTAPFFKVYTRYVSEFSDAMQTLNKMKTGPASLRKHLKQLQSHPACEFNDISIYLLSPVQRLPRYLLLVRKIIQYTKQELMKCLEEFPRMSELKKVEEALHKMLLELNEMIKGNSVNLKLVSNSRCFEGVQKCEKTNSSSFKGAAINELVAVCSNNCSESGGAKITSNILAGGATEVDLNPGYQSQSDAERKKPRARSVGGGNFWKCLKRLRFNFSSNRNNREEGEMKTTSTSISNSSKVSSGCEEVKRTSLPISKPTQDDVFRVIASQETINSQKKLRRIASNLDRGDASKMDTWRRAASARPYTRTAPNQKITIQNPHTSSQRQDRFPDSSDEGRRKCISLQAPQKAKVSEASEFVAFGSLPEDSREGKVKKRELRRSKILQNTTDSSGSTLLTQSIIPRPTKSILAKSESDSGVHTQPTVIRPFPVPSSIVYSTTSQPRWLVSRSTSRTEDSRSRPLSNAHHRQYYQRRSDVHRCARPTSMAGQGDEASRSASPTISATSLSTSPAPSPLIRESGMPKRTSVLGNMPGAGHQRIATPTSSTSEEIVQHEIDADESKMGTVFRHDPIEGSTANMSKANNEMFAITSVCGQNDNIETKTKAEALDLTNVSSDIASFHACASNACEADYHEDRMMPTKRLEIKTPPLHAFDVVPIVGRLCLEDLEE